MNGLGDPAFASDLDALHVLYHYMERHFSGGPLEDWRPKEQGTVALSSRTFTDRRYAEDAVSETLPHASDPHGTLRKLADQQNLLHLDDNVVEFSRLSQDKYSISRTESSMTDVASAFYLQAPCGSSYHFSSRRYRSSYFLIRVIPHRQRDVALSTHPPAFAPRRQRLYRCEFDSFGEFRLCS